MPELHAIATITWRARVSSISTPTRMAQIKSPDSSFLKVADRFRAVSTITTATLRTFFGTATQVDHTRESRSLQCTLVALTGEKWADNISETSMAKRTRWD